MALHGRPLNPSLSSVARSVWDHLHPNRSYGVDRGVRLEREAAGLGRRFREAINALVDRISKNPRQFPVIYKNVSRALLRRFPYSLLFVMDNDELLVIACLHASRNPSHWQRRARHRS